MDAPAYLTGRFLLAMPGIGDPRFEQSVIAICNHDAEGAIGIGVGAVIEGLDFHDLLGQFDIDVADAPNGPVHFGGPVEIRRGFVLHSSDWGGQDTIDVAGRWSLTSTVDVLRAIAEGKGPADWVISLGYAGWGGGQLDGELKRHGWLTVAGDAAALFDVLAEDRRDHLLSQAGIDARLLAATTGNA